MFDVKNPHQRNRGVELPLTWSGSHFLESKGSPGH